MAPAPVNKRGSNHQNTITRRRFFSLRICFSTSVHTAGEGRSCSSSNFCCTCFSNSLTGIVLFFLFYGYFFKPADQNGTCTCVLRTRSTITDSKHLSYFHM